MNVIKKLSNFLYSNSIALLIFFSSFFILLSFASTRLFLSDEGVILDQFYNLINGSLAIKIAKINTVKGIFILVGNNLYGLFSYSLLLLSLPIYYLLRIIDHYYGAHLFIVQLWALSGGLIIYLIMKHNNPKLAVKSGILSYCILIFSNWYFFKPIYFPKWGELLSIELTNILITSFLVLIIHQLFKKLFSDKIALFASFFVILATPISFYALTLKHHSLTLFFTLLSIYYFYKHFESKDNKFIFIAYFFAGLCVWTRILDGAILLLTLLAMDFLILKKREAKYISNVLILIIISLIPFFIFNYLILGNPFSILESTPLTDKAITLQTAKDFISLGNEGNNLQNELLNKLGYTWNTLGTNWVMMFASILFLKMNNTFGIFLVSPFIILSLVFFFHKIKYKIKYNAMDKFFILYIGILTGTYSILSIFFNRLSFISILTDTPMVIEYRYLLIGYIILLYFALRINTIKELIEVELKNIGLLYGILLILCILYFIIQFPIPFMDIYYYIAVTTMICLIIVFSMNILSNNKKPMAGILHKLCMLFISISLVQASFLMLFYYWIVSMTYISPSQNFSILPIMSNMMRWIYQILLR